MQTLVTAEKKFALKAFIQHIVIYTMIHTFILMHILVRILVHTDI